jgi:hypothetical protein
MWTNLFKLLGWITLALCCPTAATGLWVALDDEDDDDDCDE